jgi:hypothetical protein
MRSWPCSFSFPAISASPSTNQAQLSRTLGARDRDPHRLGPQLRVGVDEAAATEARVEVEAAGEAVDVVVGPERLADLSHVLLV